MAYLPECANEKEIRRVQAACFYSNNPVLVDLYKVISSCIGKYDAKTHGDGKAVMRFRKITYHAPRAPYAEAWTTEIMEEASRYFDLPIDAWRLVEGEPRKTRADIFVFPIITLTGETLAHARDKNVADMLTQTLSIYPSANGKRQTGLKAFVNNFSYARSPHGKDKAAYAFTLACLALSDTEGQAQSVLGYARVRQPVLAEAIKSVWPRADSLPSTALRIRPKLSPSGADIRRETAQAAAKTAERLGIEDLLLSALPYAYYSAGYTTRNRTYKGYGYELFHSNVAVAQAVSRAAALRIERACDEKGRHEAVKRVTDALADSLV